MQSSMSQLEAVLEDLRPAPIRWNEEILRSVLYHVLTNREFFLRHRGHLLPERLPDRPHQQMVRIANEHFDSYGVLPGVHVMREKMKEAYSRWPDEWAPTEGEIFLIYEYIECDTDVDYLHDVIVEYAKREAVKQALKDSYELVHGKNADRFEEIQRLIRDALSICARSDDGLISLRALDAKFDEAKVTLKYGIGFPAIDTELEGGLAPGEVGIFLGDSGTGKSQLLAHIAVHLLKAGARVLFVSVENGQEVVLRRFRALLGELPMKAVADQRAGVTAAIASSPSGGENLVIRCYDMGSVSIEEIAAEVDEYGLQTGWYPQVVVLDYIDEIKAYKDANTYESQGFVMRDFRAWCQSSNAAGFTATQTNRQGATTSIVTRAETGDSYWKVRRTDALWTLNCDTDEQRHGVMRLFVDKHRNGRAKFHACLRVDFGRCLFSQIQQEEYMRLMQQG